MIDKNILKILPKTELHCHLDGSISIETIKNLAKLANISIPSSKEELKKLVTAPENTESLLEYLKAFDFVRPLLQTKEALDLAAYDVVKQAALENTIYIEIRFAPELSMDKNLTAKETVEAVLNGINKAMQEFDIIAKVLVCGMKHTPKHLTLDIFNSVIELANKGLAGFDFAGNEKDYPTNYFADIIENVKKLGLPLTFHAGECGCPNNISYGLDYKIKRFGHATALSKDPELINRIIKEEATLEMCLTSNLQTKAAETIEDFPYLTLHDKGAKITINTDNRTVSNTNLTKEYSLYGLYFKANIIDFYSFNRNAILASFTSEEEKNKLLEKLKLGYSKYIKNI